MKTFIGAVRELTSETASSASTLADYPSTSTYAGSQFITVTVTRDDDTTTTPTATSTSEVALITDGSFTTSSSMTLVYVYTRSTTEASSPTSQTLSSSHGVSDLSAGAIAGIVIGSLLFLILLVLAFFCSSRGFARKKRRETSLPIDKAGPVCSTIPTTGPPPQELATQYNQSKTDGRAKPTNATGSHLYPAELQAGSTTELTASVRKGRPPGAGHLSPDGRGDTISDEGSGGYLGSGSWETVSSDGVPGRSK